MISPDTAMEVLNSIKLLFYISRALGIAPFTWRYKTFQRSRVVTHYSKILIAADTILLFLFSLNTIYYHSTTFLEALMSASHWLTMTLNSLMTVFVLCRYEDTLWENLIRLNESQVLALECFGIKRLKALKTVCAVYCSVAFIHSTAFVTLYQVKTRKRQFFIPVPAIHWICVVGLYLGLSVSYMWCIQFVIYSYIIRMWFSVLNDGLTDIPRKKLKRFKPFKRYSLGLLRVAHYLLTDVSHNLAFVFSFYFVSISFLSFVETVVTFTSYFIQKQGWFSHLNACVWLSYYLVQFFLIVIAAVNTSTQAEKTANYLHELFIDNDDPELKEEIEIFSLQLLHRKVEFNACGFFKLDFSLLYSMIGAVTTYIVILMQFQGNTAPGYGKCKAIHCNNCTVAPQSK